MSRKADEIVSIRLPRGMADEIRTLTQVPLSTLGRQLLMSFLTSRKRQMNLVTPEESPTDD